MFQEGSVEVVANLAKTTSVTIRLAKNEDAEPIKQLVFSVMQEYGLAPDPGGLDADLDDLEANYFASGGLFKVVESEKGEIVGSAGLLIRPSGVAELRKMYLKPEFRGQGIGRTLVESLLAHAREIGIRIVELETNSVLQNAIRLYVGYGFRPISRPPASRRCDQVYRLILE